MFVLINERCKTYQTGFGIFILSFGSCPGGGGGGGDFGGAQRGQKCIFVKHGHVTYQIDLDDEHNRMQVKFSSYGQTGDFWSNIINFGYHVQCCQGC